MDFQQRKRLSLLVLSCELLPWKKVSYFRTKFLFGPPNSVFSKGVAGSRKAAVDKFELYPDLIHVKKAYRDSVFELFKYIYKCKDKESCCKFDIKSNRFQWCKQYFCAD